MDILAMLSVVAMGISTVFICLVCIIIICKIMSSVIMAFEKKPVQAPVTPVKTAPAPAVSINKQQLVAAIGSAIAYDMGTDISNIKIHSIKKL